MLFPEGMGDIFANSQTGNPTGVPQTNLRVWRGANFNFPLIPVDRNNDT